MELLLGNMPGIVKRAAVNYYGRSIMYAAGKGRWLARRRIRAGSNPCRRDGKLGSDRNRRRRALAGAI